MVENFSPVIFLYGMAIVLAVGKVFTMTIWRILPKPRPPLREEVLEAWTRRRAQTAAHEQVHSSAGGSLSDSHDAEEAPHQAASGPEQTPVAQPASNSPTGR